MLIIEFTPTGVIHKVHQLTNVAPPSNQLSRDYSSGLSIEMDKEGAIFLTGRWYYSMTSDELIYTNPNGIQTILNGTDIPALTRDGIGYFVAKIGADETLSWARPYYYQNFNGREIQRYRPIELKSDKSNGVYIWGTGFKDESKAEYYHKVVLTRVDPEGKDQWTTYGTMREDRNKDRFMLAHYLEVDEQGNAFVLGTAYGSNQFGGHPSVQTVNAQFLSKVNTEGEVQWVRYLNTSIQNATLRGTSTLGLGLAIDNGLIYVRNRKCDWKFLRTFPVCYEPAETNDADQTVSVWDTDGNMLQIFPIYNSGCFSISYQMHPTIFDVKKEAIYLLGYVHETVQEIVRGFPNQNNAQVKNYLARIEEDKVYYPFITRPFRNTENCQLNFCDNEPAELEVSKLFTNIQWLVNGEVIAGENGNKIIPKIWGDYTVRATNPLGQTVETLQPTNVRVYETIVPKISQEGDSLFATPRQNYYYWYDAETDKLAFVGAHDKASKFRPEKGKNYYFKGYDGNCFVSTDTFSFDENGILSTSTTEKLQFSTLNIFPNPTNNLVTISFNPVHYQKNWQISITNMLNQQVFLETVQANSSEIQFTYNAQDLASGVYQIILQSADRKEFALGKLVVAR